MAYTGMEALNYLKPTKTIDKNKLAQAAKVNAMANVFNLLGQAAFAGQGANITPTKDIVTPYVLNQFEAERQREIAEGSQYNKLFLNELLRQQNKAEERQYQSGVRQENRQFSQDQREDQRKWQEGQNEKWRLTPDEQLSVAGLKRQQSIADQKDMAVFRQELQKRYSEAAKDPKVKFYVDKNGLTEPESISITAKAAKIAESPEIKKRFTEAGKTLLYTNLRMNPGKLTDEDKAYIFELLWPELAPYYEVLKEERINIQSAPTQSNKKTGTSATNKQTADKNKYEEVTNDINAVIESQRLSGDALKNFVYKAYGSIGMTNEQIDKIWKQINE